MSTLWIALERVADREPKSRPWKPDLNDKTLSSGLPGAWLSMHESDVSGRCRAISGSSHTHLLLGEVCLTALSCAVRHESGFERVFYCEP